MAIVMKDVIISSYQLGGSAGGGDRFVFGDGSVTPQADDDHKGWIDVISMSPPIQTSGDHGEAGLRSGGELVQAVSDEAHMGADDFLF